MVQKCIIWWNNYFTHQNILVESHKSISELEIDAELEIDLSLFSLSAQECLHEALDTTGTLYYWITLWRRRVGRQLPLQCSVWQGCCRDRTSWTKWSSTEEERPAKRPLWKQGWRWCVSRKYPSVYIPSFYTRASTTVSKMSKTSKIISLNWSNKNREKPQFLTNSQNLEAGNGCLENDQ